MKKRIIFRLPDKLYKQTHEAVKRGKAETVSELIRSALKEFLSKKGDF